MTAKHSALLLLASSLALAGCKTDSAIRKGEVVDRGTKQPAAPPTSGPAGSAASPSVDTSQFGSFKGVIHFSGKAPARVPIDMTMDPACAMSTEPNLSESIIVTAGKLANVLVYVKQGAPPSQAPAGSPTVVLDQKGCRYIPHVVAVQQGGTVEFRNSDPTMHNIHTMPTTVGNESVDVSQGPSGQPQLRQFKSPELMMPVRCNNHPWMNAFLSVIDNPYFAVSAPDGTFTIHNLPPGNYTIAVVHEKLGTQEFPVTIAPKQNLSKDITFTAK